MSRIQSLSLLRAAAPWAAGAVALVMAIATWQEGLTGALAVAAGALLAGASVAVMASGLAALLNAGSSAAGGGRWTIALFVLRHLGIAATAYIALEAGLPGTWFLAGVTAWPMALAVAGLRMTASSVVERT